MSKRKDREKKEDLSIDKGPVGNQEDGFVTKDDLKAFGSNIIETMTDIFRKEIDVHKDTISQGRVIPGHEIGQDTRGVEPVAEKDLVAEAELEKFMNDILTIYVHPTANKESQQVLLPNVNGVNQPIFRGKTCNVKRKYVEVLARNRDTRYDQRFPDLSKPHQYEMAPDTAITNPFTVRHDPDPRGAVWLQNILAEA